MKNLFLILAVIAITLVTPTLIIASFADVNNFPACPGPAGTLKVSYPTGLHWIVGNPVLQSGSDSVFNLGNGNYMQCFCPETGTNGIQTNWLKASDLTEQQRNDLINQGWIYVANGADFDLDPVAYLARNTEFSCGPNTTPNPTPTPTPSTNNGGGDGGGAPVCTDEKPKTPQLVSVNKINSTTVNIKWNQVVNANNYVVSYGPSKGNYLYGVNSTGNTDNINIGSLDPNSNYCFVIRATNHCQPGDLSNEICLQNEVQNTIGTRVGGGEVLGISTLAPTGSNQALNFVLGLFGLSLTAYGLLKIKTSKK